MGELGDKKDAVSFDERMEKLLMRKRVVTFRLWQALLAFLILVPAVVLFATLAVEGVERKASPAERLALQIASAPRIVLHLISDTIRDYNPRLAKAQRFKGEAGFRKSASAAPQGALLILSRYDGDAKRGVVEAVDLDTGVVIHSWLPDIAAINARSSLAPEFVNLQRDFTPRRYMEHHPFALDDGSLVFHGMDSPLVKIDVCARPVWTVDGEFHHSIERDADGDFWTVETIHPPSIPFVDRDFDDDALAKISSDGKVLFRKSAAQILIDANLQHVVYSHDEYDRDPIHLNDIQPVLADGPYWKRGDLFLSLRNPSIVALYRPSTNEIVWSKAGPWLMQHDVDIISDREIAVFNNNTVAAPGGGRTVGSNNIMIYDFATGEMREPFAAGFEKHRIHTETNGLFRFLPDGTVMVEEHDYGRLLAMGAEGDVKWSYVNRAAKDGRVYHLGWSRAVTGARAAALKNALAGADCAPE